MKSTLARRPDQPVNQPEQLTPTTVTRADAWTWAIAALLLVAVLKAHLLAALLAGLLVHELVDALALPLMRLRALGRDWQRVLAVALIAVVVIAVLTAAGVGIWAFLRHSDQSIPALLVRMADILETSRQHMPAWLVSSLPTDADELRVAATNWLRANADLVQITGKEVGTTLARVLLGMIIGAMLALHQAGPLRERRPLNRIVSNQAIGLAAAFRRVVFAQAWISAINTMLTWCYVGVALPLCDVHLPLIKTMLVVTFVAGLLPIVGNLISNTMVVIVSLSVSPMLGVVSLGYLVVVHKLGYFLNARIIGSHIHAAAWELLSAMLVMEALFGVPGLAAAPIFYAYFKDEFRARGLV